MVGHGDEIVGNECGVAVQDEVSKALPDMNIADKPLRYETGPTEDLTNWGEQWKRRQAEAEKKSSSG